MFEVLPPESDDNSTQGHELTVLNHVQSQVMLPRGCADGEAINPAAAYIMSLPSPNSRVTMSSILSVVASELQCPMPFFEAPWHLLLRRPVVQALMYRLRESGFAPSTQNTYLAAIKGVARESWLNGGLSSDDFQRIYAIKSSKGTRLRNIGRVIEKEEIARILGAEPQGVSHIKKLRDRAIFSLMLGSGLRRSELCSLQTKDVYLDRRFLTVIGKGDKEAKVSIQLTVIPALQRWLDAKEQSTKYFFTPIDRHGNLRNKALTPQGVNDIFKHLVEISGVARFTPHDTRRTFATRLLEAELPLDQVRNAMRHASIETTMIYRLIDDDLSLIDRADIF